MFALLSSFVLGLVYWTTAALIDRQTVTAINTEMAGLQDIYERGGTASLVAAIENRVTGYQGYHHIYILAPREGPSVVGNLREWPTVPPDRNGWLHFSVEAESEGRRQVWPAQARIVHLSSGLWLMVGRDMTERTGFARIMEQSLAFALGAALILGVIGGIVMSRNLLSRIDQVNRTARTILEGDLSGRVPVSGSGDEFDRLALNLNSMLDRIQKLVSAMREVTDNIAHDLRSPLNRMRSRLEITLVGTPDPDEYRKSLEGALEDTDAILHTFNALLSIARIEGRNATETFEPVDLTDLAAGTVELYEPVAEERGQTLTFTPPDFGKAAVVNGDRHLLTQTAANLVDNAIKYTPEGGRIRVWVDPARDSVRLVVADSGPGIPEEFRGAVLNRFVRLEQSRHTAGTGLGLSLVAAVADLHGARLDLLDNAPGLRVDLVFPEKAVRAATEAEDGAS
ncbi:HAMP domain-containing histidine kinase [Roseospira marina]|uniref:histidine kinase n=1 Tax=Roseospira marina TaxID=140057 RepID=A0A5M6ID24_9PROT|nr:HAMP domain-containing sensor histidine kinase [Roseospira marina]KAA5605972.1 HAMP domain-containing histidine kinase [Roseospira marina]MBB4313180.1 signal transduction histidine kinase [Roseospira marina]MBB5086079.1 signal transduction histidine kinase [Roseospira marina]